MRPIRVLIAEDDALNRELVELILTRVGYAVTVCPDGLAAVELAASLSFDLVVLDVVMPRMDGRQAARRLRADPRTRHLPILGLSAQGEEPAPGDGAEPLFDGYLAKPYKRMQLLAAVTRLLEERQPG